MPVPFEALLPYGIMIAMFGATGIGLATVKHFQNGKKKPRYSVDHWDRQSKTSPTRTLAQMRPVTNEVTVMERDRRITGSLRGQTDRVEPPRGFELNNPWKLERRVV